MSVENSEPQPSPTPARKMIEVPDWNNYNPDEQSPEKLNNPSSKVVGEIGEQALDTFGIESPEDKIKREQAMLLSERESESPAAREIGQRSLDELSDGKYEPGILALFSNVKLVDQEYANSPNVLIRGNGKLDGGWFLQASAVHEGKSNVLTVKGLYVKTEQLKDGQVATLHRFADLAQVEKLTSEYVILKKPNVEKPVAESIQEVDSTANPEVVVEGLANSRETSPESQTDVERIEKAIDELVASLPEQDRVPAWQYAIALHDHERTRALKMMSLETQSNKAYMEYANLFKQLQSARSKIR